MPADYLVAGAIVVASYTVSTTSKGAREEPKQAVDSVKNIFSRDSAPAREKPRTGIKMLVMIVCDDGSGNARPPLCTGSDRYHPRDCMRDVHRLTLTPVLVVQPYANVTAMWIGGRGASTWVCLAVHRCWPHFNLRCAGGCS